MIINELNNIKSDIKTAIEKKGYSVEGGLTTYADAIRGMELMPEKLQLPDGTKFGGSTANIAPDFDTSGFTDFSYMFSFCTVLKYVPEYDTSAGKDFSYMFERCDALRNLPLFDFGQAENVTGMLPEYWRNLSSQQFDIKGFKDLGKQRSIGGMDTFKYLMTREAVVNVLNNLYDRTQDLYPGVAYPTLAINLNNTILNKLTDDEIAIATNKGWRVYGVTI